MSKNYLKIFLAATGIVLVAAGCRQQVSPAASSVQQTENEPNQIIIKDFNFQTPKLTVKKGTTVTWVNQDDAHHNVIADNGVGPKSDLLAQGQSYSYTFNDVGSFSYHCDPHPYMKATVEVTE